MNAIKQKTNDNDKVSTPLPSDVKDLISELNEIVSNPLVEAAYNDAIANVQPIIEPGGEKKLDRSARRIGPDRGG